MLIHVSTSVVDRRVAQVRLLDASTAESVRQRARQAGAGSSLVDRLVPTHAADQQTAQRATLLWGSLRQQLTNAGIPVESLPVRHSLSILVKSSSCFLLTVEVRSMSVYRALKPFLAAASQCWHSC